MLVVESEVATQEHLWRATNVDTDSYGIEDMDAG
jgi:hypothetical protein